MQIIPATHLRETSIVDRAIAYINKTPPAISGSNGHGQTFSLASTLIHGFCISKEVAQYLLETHYNPRCQPQWSNRELDHKVTSAFDSPPDKPRGWLLDLKGKNHGQSASTPAFKTPKGSSDIIRNIKNILGSFRINENYLRAASPYKIPSLLQVDHFHRQGAYLIEMLFEKQELVNIVSEGKADRGAKYSPIGYGRSLPRNEWSRMLIEPHVHCACGKWIRFNPLDGNGVTDQNVTSLRFTLLEFDTVPLELQMSLLAKLPLPIAAIIFSGARSLHAWIKVAAHSMTEYRQEVSNIFSETALFGIDTKNGNPSRMSRLPGTLRGKKQQRLIYLNPEPSTDKAICP